MITNVRYMRYNGQNYIILSRNGDGKTVDSFDVIN